MKGTADNRFDRNQSQTPPDESGVVLGSTSAPYGARGHLWGVAAARRSRSLASGGARADFQSLQKQMFEAEEPAWRFCLECNKQTNSQANANC